MSHWLVTQKKRGDLSKILGFRNKYEQKTEALSSLDDDKIQKHAHVLAFLCVRMRWRERIESQSVRESWRARMAGTRRSTQRSQVDREAGSHP